MKITLNRDILIKKFLTPISKVTDQCVIKIFPEYIQTMATTTIGNPILHTRIYTDSDIGEEEEVSLNIPDINKLTRVLNCIDSDEIELEVNSNNIEYKSLGVKFKYHLLEDNVIPKVPGNPDNLKVMKFDSDFTLTKDKFSDIMRGTNFAQETKKLYFYMKDKKVFVELTDKQIANTDSVSYFITDKFNGVEIKKPMLFDLEIFKLMFPAIKEDITVKIKAPSGSANGVILFKHEEDDFVLQYMVSPLTK